MRAVSFVDRLEFDFQGTVAKGAVALGDVDNDGGNELVVGNSSGELAVFKGQSATPWQRASDMGMVTVLAVGDLFNTKRNQLVVLSGDGWCHVFEAVPAEAPCVDVPKEQQQSKLKLVHIQRIPANAKVMLLADVNDDGKIELVIGLTDRVVRTYQWVCDGTGGGRLVGIDKWEFAHQIGTISLNQMKDGSMSLLVAHPGGTFIPLKCQRLGETGSPPEKVGELLFDTQVSKRMRNPNISTEIEGNINPGAGKRADKGSPYAVATLDGTLMFAQDGDILWNLQVDHQLFALSKLDVTNDGRDEIIACSWDGQTYIVNQEKVSVRFQFEESVSTFCAGHYSVVPDKMEPCFVYVTFNNKLYLYHNLRLNNIATNSLIKIMQAQEGISDLLLSLGVDPEDKQQVKELYKWCLYGFHEDDAADSK